MVNLSGETARGKRQMTAQRFTKMPFYESQLKQRINKCCQCRLLAGNNRQVCFNGDEDMAAYANWLKEFAEKYQVHIHAWIFMTNHVYLLTTPLQENAVSKMMQSLGRQYVRYYNYTYKRSGTLWEGRFKSCVVDSSNYLLLCDQYIELNPVRVGVASQPEEYRWSSYHANALGIESSLRTPHREYLNLGGTDEERLSHYVSFFVRVLIPIHCKNQWGQAPLVF